MPESRNKMLRDNSAYSVLRVILCDVAAPIKHASGRYFFERSRQQPCKPPINPCIVLEKKTGRDSMRDRTPTCQVFFHNHCAKPCY